MGDCLYKNNIFIEDAFEDFWTSDVKLGIDYNERTRDERVLNKFEDDCELKERVLGGLGYTWNKLYIYEYDAPPMKILWPEDEKNESIRFFYRLNDLPKFYTNMNTKEEFEDVMIVLVTHWGASKTFINENVKPETQVSEMDYCGIS